MSIRGSALLCFLISLAAASLSVSRAQETDLDLAPVEKWLQSHGGLRTLQIDFDQERKMRTLKFPVKKSGKLWLDFKTKHFRWQSGDPPKVIVINDGKRLAIIQPTRKRVEYRAANNSGSSGSDAPPGLSVLAGGFPKTLPEFQKQYRILSNEREDDVFNLKTVPIQGDAARGVREFTFFIDAKDHYLRGFEIVLKDGSEVGSVFRKIVKNLEIPEDIFTVDTEGYKVSESPES